jgi:SAM-dependent methyltransferase
MTEFDKYASEYERMHAENVKASGYSPTFFDEYKIKEVHRRMKVYGQDKAPLHILNFGCGIGKSEPILRKYFPAASIVGADVSEESLSIARKNNARLENIRWEVLSEHGPIPFGDTFDLIFIANVFHHIPHSEHLRILQDLRAHLRPGGRLFLFEHNPLNPITVRTIKACPFDVDAVLLNPGYTGRQMQKAGFNSCRRQFTLFFPAFLGFLSPLETLLGWCPLGAQYYYEAHV